jgi:uncharacterized protein (DUF1800 family)
MVDKERRITAHLLRRAGFGADPTEINAATSAGYEATLNDLLNTDQHDRPAEDLLERFHSDHCDEESPRWAALKWVYRMINSERPLEEKMALMWHGVFATGWAKVTNGQMMARQYEMLRDHGLGDFRTLLQKLSRDPAMIYWLDQHTNHADAVNENYGRELLELFSMGRGNYTEEDVRSCARAFSGWTLTQVLPRYPTGYWPAEFVFRSEDHDDGEKTFLGKTGNFNGDDIIDIIVRHPATGTFVAKEIYKFFVADEPDEDAIQQIADKYFASNYEMREVMRFVLDSDFFKAAVFKRVKSPIEFIVGTIRLTGQHRNAYQFGLPNLPKLSGIMGQELLNPPTVEGWHTGREWIDSAFLVERINFATEKLTDSNAPGIVETARRISENRESITADDLIDVCMNEVVHIDLDDATKQVIEEELSISDEVSCDGDEIVEAITEILALIGASKEYQLA